MSSGSLTGTIHDDRLYPVASDRYIHNFRFETALIYGAHGNLILPNELPNGLCAEIKSEYWIVSGAGTPIHFSDGWLPGIAGNTG